MENSVSEQTLKIIQESVKSNSESIKKLEYQVISIKESNKLSDYKFNQIMETLTELNRKMDEHIKVPANRWNLIITTAIGALVSGLIAMVVFKK